MEENNMTENTPEQLVQMLTQIKQVNSDEYKSLVTQIVESHRRNLPKHYQVLLDALAKYHWTRQPQNSSFIHEGISDYVLSAYHNADESVTLVLYYAVDMANPISRLTVQGELAVDSAVRGLVETLREHPVPPKVDVTIDDETDVEIDGGEESQDTPKPSTPVSPIVNPKDPAGLVDKLVEENPGLKPDLGVPNVIDKVIFAGVEQETITQLVDNLKKYSDRTVAVDFKDNRITCTVDSATLGLGTLEMEYHPEDKELYIHHSVLLSPLTMSTKFSSGSLLSLVAYLTSKVVEVELWNVVNAIKKKIEEQNERDARLALVKKAYPHVVEAYSGLSDVKLMIEAGVLPVPRKLETLTDSDFNGILGIAPPTDVVCLLTEKAVKQMSLTDSNFNVESDVDLLVRGWINILYGYNFKLDTNVTDVSKDHDWVEKNGTEESILKVVQNLLDRNAFIETEPVNAIENQFNDILTKNNSAQLQTALREGFVTSQLLEALDTSRQGYTTEDKKTVWFRLKGIYNGEPRDHVIRLNLSAMNHVDDYSAVISMYIFVLNPDYGHPVTMRIVTYDEPKDLKELYERISALVTADENIALDS